MGLLESAYRELAEAVDGSQRVMARTRIGVYRARSGATELAREQVAALRTEAAFSLAIAGANLIEGVIAYTVSQQSATLDHLKRAHVLSVPFRAVAMCRWVEAWLALAYFDAERLVEMDNSLKAAVSDVQAGEHAVVARVATTLNVALHYFGRSDLAKPWYELARRHAVAEGDDLTIDAVLYNVAVMRLHNLRLEEIEGPVDADELHRADLELRSSVNYDRLKSSASFRWTLPLLEAQIALLQQSADAASMFRHWLAEGSTHAPTRSVIVARADLAAALARAGGLEEARDLINEARQQRARDTTSDDLALIKYRAAEVARCLGQSADHELAMAEARAHLADHRRAQQKGLATLAGVADAARLGLNLPS